MEQPEIINYLWRALAANINWVIVIIVIASGYFQKRYLKCITRFDQAIKTLIVSFVAAALYMLLIGAITSKEVLAQYFFSYFISTSFYEVILKPLTRFIETKTKTSE